MTKTKLYLVDGTTLVVNKDFETFLSEFIDAEGDFHVGTIHFSDQDTEKGHKVSVTTHSIVSIHNHG